MKTKVLFRKWHNGDVIAIFPDVLADMSPHHCSSYERAGQHGAACPDICRDLTDPATPAEYADLAAELAWLNYDLAPVKRVPRDSMDKRRAALATLA